MVEILRRGNPQLKGEVEVIECKEFPMNHPVEKKRGVRILSLHADQQFLDSLYEFPVNYPFSASVIRNVYIRGGNRRNPKDPRAKRPPGRTRLGKASVKKILTITSGEVLEQAAEESELNEKMSSADINNVRNLIINTRLCLLYTSPSPRD